MTVEPITLEVGQEALGPAHLTDARALTRLHGHDVADMQVDIRGQVVLRLEWLAQPDPDEVLQLRFGKNCRRRCRLGRIAHVLMPPCLWIS